MDAAQRKAAKHKGKGTYVQPEDIRYTKCAFCGDNMENMLFFPEIITLHPICWRVMERAIEKHNSECIKEY